MKIIRDEEKATCTLVPVETEEEQVLLSMIGVLKPGDKIRYHGRSQDGEDDKFCKIYLYAGGHEERQTIDNVSEMVQVDSIELILVGSAEEDKHNVNQLRDCCYFGHVGGLIFLNEVEAGGKKAIVVTAGLCKLCGGQMINRVACEWEVCDACAGKCAHKYERGAIHGGGLDIGIGWFCGICGRGKPKTEGERKKTQLEQHLAVERELGIMIMYERGFTPEQAVGAERLLRGYRRARSRN